MFGLDHFSVGGGIDEPAVLPGHIIPESENLDVGADLFKVAVAGFDIDIGDGLHQAIGKSRFGDQGHQEVLQAHHAGRLLEDPAADDRAARQCVIGGFIQNFGLPAQLEVHFNRIRTWPMIIIQCRHGRFLDRKIDPIKIQAALFGHMQFRAPTIDEGQIISFFKDIHPDRCGRRPLHHAEIDPKAIH